MTYCYIPLWLQGVPLETLYVYLADVRAARIQMSTGGRVVSVSYDGKSVSYSQADTSKIYGDMADIMRAIAALEGHCIRQGPVYAAF